MSDGRKRIELLKDLVIIVLLVCTFVTGRFSGVFSDLKTDGSENNVYVGSSSASVISQPTAVAVTFNDGTRCGASYDEEKANEMNSRLNAAFCEALGSANNPEQISVQQWQRLLTGESAYFEYFASAPLCVIGAWLGTTVADELKQVSVRRLVAAIDGDSIVLAFVDELSGEIFKCRTASVADGLESALSAFTPNGAQFAFQTGLSDLSLLLTAPNDIVMCCSSESTVADSAGRAALLDSFGVNSLTASFYTDSDGTQVYVENDFSLRINPMGTVVYKSSVAGTGSLEVEQAVETAYSTVSSLLASRCGEASVKYAGLTETSAGYTIEFQYFVKGLPVLLKGGYPAAIVTVSGGTISEIRMTLMSFSASDDSVQILPEKQAAAACEGELLMVYVDDGAGRVVPDWAMRN